MELSNDYCGRRGKINYADPDVMKRRRGAALTRRQRARRGTFILARWIILDDGTLSLEGIAMQPGYWIDRSAALTRSLQGLYRWATKQACYQYRKYNRKYNPNYEGLQVINLKALLTRGQVAGVMSLLEEQATKTRRPIGVLTPGQQEHNQ